MQKLKAERGISLLEVLLVIAIASSILLMGLRVYQQYSVDAYAQQVKYTVDQVFQAMAHYHQVNCQNLVGPDGKVTRKGDLSFSSSAPPKQPHVIDIENDLLTDPNNQGNVFLPTWQPLNPLIDPTAGTKGFFAQFNPPSKLDQRMVYYCQNLNQDLGGVNKCDPSALQPLQQNTPTILLWSIQVAIKLNTQDPDKQQMYMNLLGADCISTLQGTNEVAPCSSASNPSGGSSSGGYLVWSRLPSMASPNTTSSLWESTPLLTQFNRQYQMDEVYEFNNSSYASQTYYTCGG